MIRSRPSFALAGLVLAFSLAATALAQEGGRGGRRGGGQGGPGGFGGFGGLGGTIDKPALLGSEQVRTELKIAGDQAKKVDEVLASHREASRELFSGFGRDQSEEERAKAREESAKKRAELLKKTEAKIAEVLEKAQLQRLDEIALQQQGADGLVADNVIAALKLSKEQVEKIRGAISTRDTELGKLRGGFRRGGGGGAGGPGGPGGGFEEIREKSEKLRKDAETAVLAVLSKEQTESYTKLKGAAFELDRRTLRGAFGGGPGGGPGGDRGKERKRPPADDEKKADDKK